MSALVRKQIIDTAKRLYSARLIAAADGNISQRVSDKEIWITPSGKHKNEIKENDLALVTLENEVLGGEPSGERLMHLAIYRAVPQAVCVVHAHPPTAIAWTLARPSWQELPLESLSEGILALGRVPIVPYQRPGTAEMGSACLSYLPDCRVLLLARHGALSWGESLDEAFMGMERLEAVAHILGIAEQLGGAQRLSADELDYLYRLRRSLGPQSR